MPTEPFVLMLALMTAAPQVGVRSLARHDGLLLEMTSGVPMAPEVSASGYSVTVTPGPAPLSLPAGGLPFWVLGWSLSPDSTSMTVLATQDVDSLRYALSPDSLTFLLFLGAAEPLGFPSLSWEGPPAEPEYRAATAPASDSVTLAAFQQGGQSPWLGEFDRVVLDPGHGGRDPGAIGPSGTYEKDRTLEIALLVRDILAVRRPDLEVVMTRTTDEYVSLGERTRLANAQRADLFVSIHCNAANRNSARGIETFFLSTARTDEARAVEMLENSVADIYGEDEPVPTDPLSFLLADMAQSIYQERSSSLAVTIQESLAGAWGELPDRGVKQAGFYVLRGALMPAVLVEVGFISNPEEETLLRSLDFRLGTAEAIVDAILAFAEGGG